MFFWAIFDVWAIFEDFWDDFRYTFRLLEASKALPTKAQNSLGKGRSRVSLALTSGLGRLVFSQDLRATERR